MNPELLRLIERWRERHPEAWPEGLEIDTSRGFPIRVDYADNPLGIVPFLALIESAVMDWLGKGEHCLSIQQTGPLWYVTRWDEDVASESVYAPTRLYALLLTVEEMEAA